MTMNERIESGLLFSDNCGHEAVGEGAQMRIEHAAMYFQLIPHITWQKAPFYSKPMAGLKKVSNAEKNQLTYFDGWHALSIVTKDISIDPY